MTSRHGFGSLALALVAGWLGVPPASAQVVPSRAFEDRSVWHAYETEAERRKRLGEFWMASLSQSPPLVLAGSSAGGPPLTTIAPVSRRGQAALPAPVAPSPISFTTVPTPGPTAAFNFTPTPTLAPASAGLALTIRPAPVLSAPPVAVPAAPNLAGLGRPVVVATTSAFVSVAGPVARPFAPAGAAAPGLDLTYRTTNEILLVLRPGVDAAALARDYGLVDTGGLADATNFRIFRAGTAAAAATAHARFGTDGRIVEAELFNDAPRVTQSFAPDDPFFFPGSNPAIGGPGSTNSTRFPGQWHLENNYPAASFNDRSVNVNIRGAWDANWTGAGVIVAVVDDAVQVSNPDLAPNNAAVASLNRNFFSSGTNPDPDPTGTSNHGTAVAGVAAARGGNGLGGTGAAPFASLVGIRTQLTNAAIANALTHANGTGPGDIRIKNHSYGYNIPYVNDPAILAIRASADAGTVNVYSAGNYRGAVAEDSGKSRAHNLPGVVVVAALGSNGTRASYSNFGANVTVAAPSNSNGAFAITTTDRVGSVGYNTNGSNNFAGTASGGSGLDYTNAFGGTSSAAPLVAGVLALAIEANPDLRPRSVKHLLARTSRVIHAGDTSPESDGGWRTNAAGIRFNQNYGFGLIDATALVNTAQQFSGVTALTTFGTGTITVNATLPDGGNAVGTAPGAFVSRTVTVNVPLDDRQPLEEVLVTLSVTHPQRGDLEAYLESPGGYRSRLFYRRADDTGDNLSNWTFLTNAFWGEQPNGTWQLDVRDVFSGNTGSFNSFSVQFNMGQLVPVPEPAGVGLFAALAVGGVTWLRRRKSADHALAA